MFVLYVEIVSSTEKKSTNTTKPQELLAVKIHTLTSNWYIFTATNKSILGSDSGTDLLEPDTWKTCKSGSEGGKEQQCSCPTRQRQRVKTIDLALFVAVALMSAEDENIIKNDHL